MKVEVNPSESTAWNAKRSAGAISSTFSKKNSVGRPLSLGALPLGREVMAFTFFFQSQFLGHFSVHVLHDSGGTLSQHLLCASAMPSECDSDVYKLA
jgi:hypothetical protein